MHRLRVVTLTLGMTVSAIAPAPSALARGSRSAHAECDNGGCVSQALNVPEVPGRRFLPRRRTPSACTFKPLLLSEGTPVYRSDGSAVEVDGTGRWYDKRCQIRVPQSNVAFGSTRGYGEFGRRTETSELVYLRRRAAPPVELATEALGHLPLPEPALSTSPPPDFDSVVNLPVFLWIPKDEWQPRSATAEVPGVSVTVTAVPDRVVWDMGNGDTVTCYGPGEPWVAHLPDEAQPSTCRYTYRNTSAGQPEERFVVRATVVWRASWSVVGAPGGGDLGEVARTTTTRLRVAQVQTVNVH